MGRSEQALLRVRPILIVSVVAIITSGIVAALANRFVGLRVSTKDLSLANERDRALGLEPPEISHNTDPGKVYYSQIPDTNPWQVSYWLPQSRDLPRGMSSTKVELNHILWNTVLVPYTVKKGDSLDRILRNRLFISSTLYPRAYTTYLDNIALRNGIRKRDLIHPDDKIALPSGPHYGAREAPLKDLAVYRMRASQLLGVPFGKSQPDRALYRALARYTFHFGPVAPGKKGRDHALQEIEDRRILPANNLDPGFEREPVVIVDWFTSPASDEQQSTLYISQMSDGSAKCGGHCATCKSLVSEAEKIASDERKERMADVSTPKHSLLYIIDTGSDPATKIPEGHVWFSPSYPDYSDIAGNRHGTFNYTETVNSFFGPVDPSDVYIAKAAVPKTPGTLDGRVNIYMPSVYDSIYQLFAKQETEQNFVGAGGRAKIGPTWIVNLSIYGHMNPGLKSLKNLLPEEQKVLFVVAAGNDHTATGLDEMVYTQLESQWNVLVVGALDETQKQRAEYSNHSHTYVDIFAPGSCMCGSAKVVDPGSPDTKNQINGTSQAAPVISVMAKMLAEQFRTWTAKDIKWRLISTSDFTDLPSDGKGGAVNIVRAIKNSRDETLIAVIPPEKVKALSERAREAAQTLAKAEEEAKKDSALASNSEVLEARSKAIESQEAVDKSTQEIRADYVEPTNDEWIKVLKPNEENAVLRLHRVWLCESKKVCFQVMRYPAGFSDLIITLSPKDELGYKIRGVPNKIKAEQLVDLYQPIRSY